MRASGSFEKLQSKFTHFMNSQGSFKASQKHPERLTSDENRIEKKTEKKEKVTYSRYPDEESFENVVTPSPMPEPPVARPSLRMPKKQKETPKPP